MTALQAKPGTAANQVVVALDDRAVEQIVNLVVQCLSEGRASESRQAIPVGCDIAVAPKRRAVDTKTRYEGVFARHRVSCAKAIDRDRRCGCRPSYYGSVWEPEGGHQRRTERRPSVREAKRLRDELLDEVRAETSLLRARALPLEQVAEKFIGDCRSGVALNKHGEPYKPKAITNLWSSLNSLPATIRDKPLGDVTGADLQEAIDDYLRRDLSGSRINSIINAVRSLYTWAIHRGKVSTTPATNLRLPVVRYREARRIAKPGELADLLDRLEPEDALPWALAAYGTARYQEIQILEWKEVDFDNDVMLLADNDEARKSDAAWRIVPIVSQLRARLWAEWIRQGEPETGRVCPPRAKSKSGLLSLNGLSKRVAREWRDLGLEPIGLQDSRHTAATWLDHAGVSPKVASVIMGHKAPNRELYPDAAPITLRRYTHILEGELERARAQLGAFLSEREAEEKEVSAENGSSEAAAAS